MWGDYLSSVGGGYGGAGGGDGDDDDDEGDYGNQVASYELSAFLRLSGSRMRASVVRRL